MVPAGISLPALMHLMGHAQHAHIQTTMLYVQLAPEDVWREYERLSNMAWQLSRYRRKCHEAICKTWIRSWKRKFSALPPLPGHAP